MRRIPIQNLYFLFLYAWDRFPDGRGIDVGSDTAPDLPNLLAKVLLSITRRLLRRGLDRGYQGVEQDLEAPRGRFILSETIKKNCLPAGRIVCRYDELSADVPHNRILKATLLTLAKSEKVDASLTPELFTMVRRFSGVADARLSRDLFRTLQLSRNSGHYGLAMKVCELALMQSMPDEVNGRSRFFEVQEDDAKMAVVFEAFARNFYFHEQREFSVASKMIKWGLEFGSERSANFLPSMITDVFLKSKSKNIILDTKYYPDIFSSKQGWSPKLRSAHLYQILSYLTNAEASAEPVNSLEGVLLYPFVPGQAVAHEDFPLEYVISGHRIRVCAVDLNQPWPNVHMQMLAAIGLTEPKTPALANRGAA